MQYSKSCLILLSGLISTSALAVDFTKINITATVVASPCTVATTSLDIPLGNIQASSLGTAQPWSQPKPIQLTNCPASTTGVRATFSGTPASNGDTNGYKNEGADAGISVQLSDGAATPNYYSNGKSTDYATVANHAVAFNIAARLYSSGSPQPGPVSSTVNVTFEYK
jgi:minor fimbrial subunit